MPLDDTALDQLFRAARTRNAWKKESLPDQTWRDLYDLGSGLIDQSQKMTVAAMHMADMKVWAHRS